MKLRDTLWIWGQDPGSHHAVGGNAWKLPGVNRMGPLEGCRYLGIPNCCRVVMGGSPEPPFDGEADRLDCLREVVWSLIGDSGSKRNNDGTDLEEVIRVAASHPNITGGIMDDFMNPTRMKIFTPEVLAGFRERLHTALPGRPLDFWTVLYTHELTPAAVPYLAQVDLISLWTWHGRDLPALPENLEKLRSLVGTEKPVLCGCYLWDYGACAPLDPAWMAFQLDTYLAWLRERRIDGVIFCSNCIADVGIEAAETARAWIAAHGDEEI